MLSFLLVSLCISQLSTLLTYASIEFWSFRLPDFSLSLAQKYTCTCICCVHVVYRDNNAALSKKYCNTECVLTFCNISNKITYYLFECCSKLLDDCLFAGKTVVSKFCIVNSSSNCASLVSLLCRTELFHIMYVISYLELGHDNHACPIQRELNSGDFRFYTEFPCHKVARKRPHLENSTVSAAEGARERIADPALRLIKFSRSVLLLSLSPLVSHRYKTLPPVVLPLGDLPFPRRSCVNLP